MRSRFAALKMVLEGVVTNVTKFGAFVDIGVHQDGLVHISELANRYVKDASDAVTVGQIVKVKVLSADPKTKRIALSIKALEEPTRRPAKPESKAPATFQAKSPGKGPAKPQHKGKPLPPHKPEPTLEEQIAFLNSKWRTR